MTREEREVGKDSVRCVCVCVCECAGVNQVMAGEREAFSQ